MKTHAALSSVLAMLSFDKNEPFSRNKATNMFIKIFVA